MGSRITFYFWPLSLFFFFVHFCSFLSLLRFHRRKLQVPSIDDYNIAPGDHSTTPEINKKSWFGNLMGMERDESHVILIKDRPLAVIKADLIHSFLSVSS